MPDREKVIKDNAIRGLQSALEISGALVHLRKEHAKAILSMLKEQEAVEPYHVNTNHEQHWKCGKCNAVISVQDKFCHECGSPILWKGR